MEAHGGCGCKDPHMTSHGTRLVLCSAAFTPRESPWYSFYRRLSGPQDQSGHEGVKKNLHPSNTRDPTWVIQPIAQHLATTITIPLPLLINRASIVHREGFHILSLEPSTQDLLTKPPSVTSCKPLTTSANLLRTLATTPII